MDTLKSIDADIKYRLPLLNPTQKNSFDGDQNFCR